MEGLLLHVYYIKTGGVIDGQKVTREEFFDVLNAWGKTDKRFVVKRQDMRLNHSTMSDLVLREWMKME